MYWQFYNLSKIGEPPVVIGINPLSRRVTSRFRSPGSAAMPCSWVKTIGAPCRRPCTWSRSRGCASRSLRAWPRRRTSSRTSSTGELEARLYDGRPEGREAHRRRRAKTQSRGAPADSRGRPIPEPASVREARGRPCGCLFASYQYPAPARLPDPQRGPRTFRSLRSSDKMAYAPGIRLIDTNLRPYCNSTIPTLRLHTVAQNKYGLVYATNLDMDSFECMGSCTVPCTSTFLEARACA